MLKVCVIGMMVEPFYVPGLQFSCTRCSSCCRYEPGFVFISKKDADFLAARLKMGYIEFMDVYCRWVPAGEGMEHLSLKEKAGYDCIFWDRGCSVYEARPLQCRTFPFWPSILASAGNWKEAAAHCPGMGQGILHNREYIDTCLRDRRQEPVIARRAVNTGGY